MNKQMPQYDVFLSYSSQDKELAEDVYNCISDANLACFMAEKRIQAGQSWVATIEEAVKSSVQVVFLLTANIQSSNWVSVELGMARALRKEVIPVLAAPATAAEGVLSVFKDIGLQYAQIDPTEIESIRELARQLASRSDFVGFWQSFLHGRTPGQGIHIVLSAKPPKEMVFGHADHRHQGHTILVSYNEVHAFVELRRALTSLSEDLDDLITLHHGGVDLRESSRISSPDVLRPLGVKRIGDRDTVVIDGVDEEHLKVPEFPLSESLIIVGSSHANLICETVLHSLRKEQDRGMPFTFDTEGDDKCIRWKEHECFVDDDARDADGKAYGVIVHVRNPFCPQNRALILAGNHGFGTQAAVQFVSDRRFIQQLKEKAGPSLAATDDFVVLFQARVRNEQGLAEHLDIQKIAISDGESRWQIIYA